MDLGTVIGMSLSFILIGSAMMLGVGIGPYIDIPSVMITIGGSITSLLIAFKLENMKKFFTYFAIAFKPQTFDVPALIKKLVDYSTQARRDGILSLEQQSNQEENEFLKRGLNMALMEQSPIALEICLKQVWIGHWSDINLMQVFLVLGLLMRVHMGCWGFWLGLLRCF